MNRKRASSRARGLRRALTAALLWVLAAIVATLLHSQAQKENAVAISTFLAREMSARLSQRETALELFTDIAETSDTTLVELRRRARAITEVLGGWFVIARPGTTMDVLFTSLGDGSVPNPIPRSPTYNALLDAEREAKATGRPALSAVFVGQKSGVPTVTLVREAEILGSTRFVYFSMPASDLTGNMLDSLSGSFPVRVLDGNGVVVAARTTGGAFTEQERSASLLPSIRVTKSIFGSWQIEVLVFPTWDDVALHFAILATALLSISVLAWGHWRSNGRAFIPETAIAKPYEEGDIGDTKEKLELFLTLGHELRSPLISLLSAIDMVKRNPDLQTELYLDHATQEAHNLLRLIDDLLACAKISGETIALNREVYDPLDLAETCIRTIRTLARQYKSILSVESSLNDTERVVIGDRAKVRQILINFLSNAVKYGGEGEVTVRIEVRKRLDSARVLVYWVEDRGPGIDSGRQPTIFTSIGLGADLSVKPTSSNGIGLVTSRLLAEAMGGTVGVQSGPGVGSRFWLEVPFEQPLQLLGSGDTASISQLYGLRILLAEDDAIVRHLITDDLVRCGASVTSVSSGEALLEEYERNEFDVILTDIRMDGISGYDVAQHIRQRGSDHPILIGISAHYRLRDDGEESRIFDFVLEKPFSVHTFVEKMDSLCAWPGPETIDDLQLGKIAAAYGDDAPVLFRRVLEDMRSGLTQCELLCSSDSAGIERLAHKMAGSASTIGARILADALRCVESASGKGDMTLLGTALSAARTHLDAFEGHLVARELYIPE